MSVRSFVPSLSASDVLSRLALFVILLLVTTSAAALHLRLRGRGKSRSVLTIGLIVTVIAIGGWGLMVARRPPSYPGLTCLSAVKAMAVAAWEYSSKNGAFMSTRRWREDLGPYLDRAPKLACPRAPRDSSGYAYNAALSGVRVGDLRNPSRTVVIFESDGAEDHAGGSEMLPERPRHSGGDNYGFADGHAQWIKRKKRADGTWAKEPEADWVRWKP